MSTSFNIASEKFVGPIELLLQLVRKRKLHISEISLAEVAESFLEHFKQMPDMPLHHSTHFLGVVAVLVYVKSRSLLPGLDSGDEADTALRELAGRVELYALLKEIAGMLRVCEQKSTVVVRKPMRIKSTGFRPDPRITGYQLNRTLGQLMSRNAQSFIPIKERAKQTLRPRIALRQVLETIQKSVVAARKPTALSAVVMMLQSAGEGMTESPRDATIGSLLAALEMARENVVDLDQVSHFTEITIYPKYL